MELKSLIQYYCDNNEVVTKLRKITEKDRNYYSSSSKIKDLDVILEIQTCIPTIVTVTHVKGHQDRKKIKDQRTMAENLNIKVDGIIGKILSLQSIFTSATPPWWYILTRPTPHTISEKK